MVHNQEHVPKPGDIVILKGEAKTSNFVLFLQKLRFPFSKPESTHIAIYLSEGVFIHSVSEGGVSFTTFNTIFNTNSYKNWKVIRNRTLEFRLKEGQVSGKHLESVFIYYIGQSYNFLFGRKSKNNSKKFCSELAASIYQQLGISIMDIAPSKIYPHHFELLDKKSEWYDVTEIHNNEFVLKEEFESSIEIFKEISELEATFYKSHIRRAQLKIKEIEFQLSFHLSSYESSKKTSKEINKLLDKELRKKLGLSQNGKVTPNYNEINWKTDKSKKKK